MTPNLKILIVDDHNGMRQTLQDILEEESFMVSVAGSGEEALEICATIRFEVVLMDVRMPGLNGVETLRRLKEFALDTTVILMTAYSVEELRTAALHEGAIAFLKKPLDIKHLLTILHNLKKQQNADLLQKPREIEDDTTGK